MSKTKNELKKEVKNIKAIYSSVIKTKCIECLGFFRDRELCTQADCPLYPFTFRRGDLRKKIFRRLIRVYKEALGSEQYPGPTFWLGVLQEEVLGSKNGVKKYQR